MTASASPAARAEWTASVYRRLACPDDLLSFEVRVEQSDLMIFAQRPLEAPALGLVLDARRQITDYMKRFPEFAVSLTPLPPDATAAPVVSAMLQASRKAGVGPMAAVAGAIAEYVGRGLSAQSEEIIVENGGDVFMRSRRRREIALLAENTALVGLRVAVPSAPQGLGLATSAGTLGHSLSFGKADAVTVLAGSAALADAIATAIGNEVCKASDLQRALDIGQALGARGIVIVADNHLAAWGAFEILE
ncbi:MAG: UPF0280 family protein [Betaproteobacteria bacterium]|nr:UPF0280 family protein [Betaproteobacteria bacterium]